MATILDLLMALNRGDLPPLPAPAPSAPIPLAPVGNLGPLSNDTALAFAAQNPEPVPPRFVEPAAPDMNFVSQQTGAAPTPPAPLSRAQRIMNAIAGFGAGVQGQGAQFLQQLNEPRREYQRQVERYEGRRTQALDRAERAAEREADRVNRAAELQYNRDYNLYLKKLGIRQDEADERTKQAFDIYKLDRQAKIEEKREAARERREQEREATRLEGTYFSLTKNRPLSIELARHYSGLSAKPLSKPAAALDAKLQQIGEARMGRAAGVGGGGTGVNKLVEQFENLKRQLYPARERGDEAAENGIMRRIEALGSKLQAKGYEVGYGDDPYVKPRGATAQQAAPQQPTAQFPEFDPTKIFNLAPVPMSSAPSDDDVKAYAKRFKMSLKKARAELMGQ